MSFSGNFSGTFGGIFSGRFTGLIDLTQPLAWDTFTDTDTTELNLHLSDSGHSWISINGSIQIISNTADLLTAPGGWHHYGFNLTGLTKQPNKVSVDVKNTNITLNTAGISLRDNLDDANFVYCTLFANSSSLTLAIAEYVAGVETLKNSINILGDFRNSTDFFRVHITDTGDTITLDGRSIDPAAIVSWNTAPPATYKSVGFYQQSGSITDTLFDNLEVRG